MPQFLIVGGLVAAGFDSTGEYLLTITHSGRGVFSTSTWKRIARDYASAYPEDRQGIGIGPIAGESIAVTCLDSGDPCELVSADGRIRLRLESSVIEVLQTDG